MKFCKDCKHYRPDDYRVLFFKIKGEPELATCAAFPNPVTGSGWEYCGPERKYGTSCGPEAKLWEPA